MNSERYWWDAWFESQAVPPALRIPESAWPGLPGAILRAADHTARVAELIHLHEQPTHGGADAARWPRDVLPHESRD